MKTPQIPAMPGMSPLGIAKRIAKVQQSYTAGQLVNLNRLATDEKTVAERKWRSPLKPKAEQQACDAGLFSDDSKQTELFK